MKLFYKILLIVFIVFTGINFYAINWEMGIFADDNLKFWISIAAGIFGILFTLIMDSLSRIKLKVV